MLFLFIIALVFIAILSYFLKRESSEKVRFKKCLNKIAKAIGESEDSPKSYLVEKVKETFSNDEESIRQLQRKQNDILTILNNIVDPIALVRNDGSITFANTAAKYISRPGIESRKIYEVFEDYFINQMFDQAVNSGEIVSGQVTLYVKSDRRYYEMKVVPTKFEEGDTRYIVVLHDKTTETKLDNARKEFISNVSHELRTPLTSIHGYAETLLDDPLDDKDLVRKFLGIIEEEAARMTRLINDLLDLEKLESGESKFEMDTVELNEILQYVQKIITPLAEEYGVKTIFGETDIKLKGDRDRLVQMVLNLVDNAVKYTSLNDHDPKEVRVNVKTDKTFAVVCVQDTGPGIPDESKAKLFERFYRVDKARSRKMGGTGLGLSIVKMIAERHGGHIEFESEYGKGSTFYAYIPLLGGNNDENVRPDSEKKE
jgi:two-component system phosphate regulon sensor histidine kinase PhoR